MYIANFELSVINMNNFTSDIIDFNQEEAKQAFRKMVLNRTNPDLDEFEILDRLRKNGLKDSNDYFHSLL